MSEPSDRVARRKVALAAAIRAISGRKDLEVSFSGPAVSGVATAALPIGEEAYASPERLSELRGQADALALRLRFHDESDDARYKPAGQTAKMIFDAVETARIEALGSILYKGVAQNLHAALEAGLTKRELDRVENQQDAPLADAVGLLLRRKSCDQELPPTARKLVSFWQGWIENQAGKELERLTHNLHDQSTFASLSRDLITGLGYAEELGTEDDDDRRADGDTNGVENEDGTTVPDDSELVQIAGDADHADSETFLREIDTAHDTGASRTHRASIDRGFDPFGSEVHDDVQQRFARYHVYTRAFDETVFATDLCDREALARMRNELHEDTKPLKRVIIKLANRLQRIVLAKQNRSWKFDQEEGLLDASRLAGVIVDPYQSLYFKQEQEADFADTVVSLLIDCSGSMRGHPIKVAALCADVLAQTLERCSVKVEILGFTTSKWKGGRAREQWVSDGCPANPGRLNDLRHIIYKTADTPWRRSKNNLGLMMRDSMLKENIDGEALVWAHERLLGRPEQRRILMVISDGSPVDDSTLTVNPGNYLDRHLLAVITEIEQRSPVELIAIGVDHDVTRYYQRAVTIHNIEELGGAMIDQLAALFGSS